MTTSSHSDVLHKFVNEALEGSLADRELCALLVLADLAEGDGSGTVTMALLHYGLASALGGELLERSPSSSGHAGGLFGSNHARKCIASFKYTG
jgi:hypothetical protein